MIQRKTQTEQFWREEYKVSSEDLGRIYDSILDRGQPVAAADIVRSIIEFRCRREEVSIEAELDRGEIYQPKNRYETGQQILFPQLGFAVGTVVGSRSARNPEYGQFTAIKVQMDGEQQVREFASELLGEHRLNRREGEPDPTIAGELQTPTELQELFGAVVVAKLEADMQAHDEFVRVADTWFLRELLVDVNIGQLNIAEALIEIKSMPLPTGDLLPDLDLPAEVSEEIRLLSLNRALEADGRFNNIGDSGRDVWYLRRLTPKQVVSPPGGLVLQPDQFDRLTVSGELLLLEREIDDEGSGLDVLGPSRPVYRTSVVLPFSHWRYGTLPLTAKTQGLFPESTNHHSPIILVDGQSGARMQGWVVHGASFVYGLGNWIERNGLPAGAVIKLERTRDPRVIRVDIEPERLRRLWIPIATVREGSVSFQLRKKPVSCQFDEHMLMGEDSHQEADQLWASLQRQGAGLLDVMMLVLPELVKLSPQNTVHAKTIYNAVNVLRRTAPGPIFSLLSTEACFVAMGGGFWAFDEALVGKQAG